VDCEPARLARHVECLDQALATTPWGRRRSGTGRKARAALVEWGELFRREPAVSAEEQTALYMANAETAIPARRSRGLFDEVQDRFRRRIGADTKIVIGHALGSVIAYEGLWAVAPEVSVHTLLTLGCPIGVQSAVYDRLRPRGRVRRPWPGVCRWLNVSTVAAAGLPPAAPLASLFEGDVEDQSVRHATLPPTSLASIAAHSIVHYFGHECVLDAVARALGEPAALVPEPLSP
jgi:hypothetical protein